MPNIYSFWSDYSFDKSDDCFPHVLKHPKKYLVDKNYCKKDNGKLLTIQEHKIIILLYYKTFDSCICTKL